MKYILLCDLNGDSESARQLVLHYATELWKFTWTCSW